MKLQLPAPHKVVRFTYTSSDGKVTVREGFLLGVSWKYLSRPNREAWALEYARPDTGEVFTIMLEGVHLDTLQEVSCHTGPTLDSLLGSSSLSSM